MRSATCWSVGFVRADIAGFENALLICWKVLFRRETSEWHAEQLCAEKYVLPAVVFPLRFDGIPKHPVSPLVVKHPPGVGVDVRVGVGVAVLVGVDVVIGVAVLVGVGDAEIGVCLGVLVTVGASVGVALFLGVAVGATFVDVG